MAQISLDRDFAARKHTVWKLIKVKAKYCKFRNFREGFFTCASTFALILPFVKFM